MKIQLFAQILLSISAVLLLAGFFLAYKYKTFLKRDRIRKFMDKIVAEIEILLPAKLLETNSEDRHPNIIFQSNEYCDLIYTYLGQLIDHLGYTVVNYKINLEYDRICFDAHVEDQKISMVLSQSNDFNSIPKEYRLEFI
jgi:hypothetical protein